MSLLLLLNEAAGGAPQTVDLDTGDHGIAGAEAFGTPTVYGPILVTLLTDNGQGGDAYADTDSISPPANKPVFVFVVTMETGASAALLPTVSGCGMTWTQVETQLSPASDVRVTLFRGLHASPSTGILTLSASGEVDAWAWTVCYVDNADTSGTNGANAVGNIADDAALTVTLPAFASSSNAALAGFAQRGTIAEHTPEAGWTELSEVQLTGYLSHKAIWRNDTADTTPSITSDEAGTERAGVAIELRHVSTAASLNQSVSVDDIASEEAFGTATVTSSITLSVTGIASAEAIGDETWCGNTYYVTTGGNDANTGRGITAGTAWRNPRKLIQSMPRYGIGKIRSGTYLDLIPPNGFIGSRGDFLVMNYPGDDAIIEHNSTASENLFLYNMENVRGISFMGGGTRTLPDGTTVSYDGQATGSLTIRKTGTPAQAGTAALLRFYYDSSKPIGATNLYGNADRVRIRGVNFGAVNGYAIRCASTNVANEVNDIIIEGCTFDGAANSISVQYCEDVYIQYNRFVETGRMIDNSGDNNDNGGVHVSLQTGSHDVFVRYNDITGGVAASSYYGFDGGAVEFFGSYNTDTSYNLIYDCEGGIEDGTPNRTTWTMDSNVVHHNIFRGRFAWGTTATPLIGPDDSPVILHRAGSNYKLYNNTFDLTGPHGNAIRMQYSTGGNYNGEIDGSRIENNLILLGYAPYQFNPGQGPSQTAPPLYPGGAGQPLNNAWAALGLELNNVQVETGIVVDYNNVWNTTGDVRVAVYNGVYYTRSQLTTFRSGTPYGDNDVWANPVVIDADTGDYHLEETSPLIDAGAVLTPYTDGYLGDAPDIGRWEYTQLPLQVSSAGGVASLEAFGTATLTTGNVTVTASGIAGAETFGTADLFVGVANAGGIASEEAFGALTFILEDTAVEDAGGIASEEAFGTPGLAVLISPTSILSEEEFGLPVGSPNLTYFAALPMSLVGTRYATAYDADYDTYDSTLLIQGGGSDQVSAVGQEDVGGQLRDHQTLWGQSFELGSVALVEGTFSAYFVAWVNPPTAGTFDLQIRHAGTSATLFYSPSELAALPLVAHLNSDDIVNDARNDFVNDVDLTTIFDISDPDTSVIFVLCSSSLVAGSPPGSGVVEVVSYITTGAFIDAEDKLAYEPLLSISYVSLPEGTVLAGSIATEEAVGEPSVAITNAYVEPDGIATEEALGDLVLTTGMAYVLAEAIDTLEAFGLPTLTVNVYLYPSGIATLEAFGTSRIGVVYAPRGLTGAIEYCVEIYDSGTGFGPGTKVGELWDARNVGWSRYDRLPGKAFLTLYQDSRHLSEFSPLLTHVKITRVTPTYDTQVYAGEFIDYDSSGDDVVLSFFDYVSLFAVSRSGYKTMYPKTRLSEIVAHEVAAARSAAYSPLGFIINGTIQVPVGEDGVTEIITNEQFGTMDQMRLQLLWDLSEMARTNTVNHVTFEISRTAPYVFNFWKNKGTNQNIGLVLNGSVDDYQYLPNWTRYRNDLATLGTTVGGGATEIVQTNETAASIRGLRQDVATIKTLLGITSASAETDQQRMATGVMVMNMTQRMPALMINLTRDAMAPFEGWEICDTVVVEIVNGVDNLTARQRIVGVRCIYTEAGEDMGLILEPIPS